MPEINWNLLQVPDIGKSFSDAYQGGLQRNAMAEYARNPNEQSLNALAPYNPQFVAQQKQQMDAGKQAELQKRAELIGQVAQWADTPEKWDAGVDYLTGMYPDLAQYKGKFSPDTRMAAITAAGQLKEHLAQNKPINMAPGNELVQPDGTIIHKAPFAPHYGTVKPGESDYVYDPNTSGDPYDKILKLEGGANPDGSFRTSPKGAVGPAQLMPTTAPEAMAAAGMDPNDQRWKTDPNVNIAAGKAYYGKLLQQFGDPTLAAAAYNAGAGRVQSALDQAKATGKPWTTFLPAETQNYIAKFGGGTKVIAQGPQASGGNTPDGLLSKGYRMKPDGTMEPVPGGPADPGTVELPPAKEIAKRNASYPKVSTAYRGASTKIDQQIAALEKLKTMPGLDRIVGLVDSRTPNISGDARAAMALYNQIMARGQFNELQDMRNNSPTGGALGQVSDSENKTLRQAAAALDRDQDETDFRARVDDYMFALKQSRANLDQAFSDTYAYRDAMKGATTPAPKTAPKAPTVSNW